MSETLTYESLQALVDEVDRLSPADLRIEEALREAIATMRLGGESPTHLLVPLAHDYGARHIAKRLGLEVRATKWLTDDETWFLLNAKPIDVDGTHWW